MKIINESFANELISKEQLDGYQLQSLLEARDMDIVDFELIDVREYSEYEDEHIIGTDAIISTSSFKQRVKDIFNKKKKPIILYCYSGSRSARVQFFMRSLGFEHILNLQYGISDFYGATQRG